MKERTDEQKAQLVLDLARHGFHGRLIADRVGWTVAQVYSFVAASGLSLRDYRDGKTKEAVTVLARVEATVVHVVRKIRA